jgi:hypothetical protein
VSIEIHHVVKVTGPRSFSERPQFLSESFLTGVAIGPDSPFGAIRVGVKYLAMHRRKHQSFIRRQVELDLGPAARGRRNGPAVTYLALAIGSSTGVVVDIEFELIWGNVETRLLRYPGGDFFENRPQEFLINLVFVA